MTTSYNKLNDNDKLNIIQKYYIDQKLSFNDIASLLGTYANKIRRDAKKFNINIRDKKEAQKNALSSGKHKHPTKGTKRSNETKSKIGLGVFDAWQNLSDNELAARKQKNKENWNNMTEEQKKNMSKAATDAIRVSSRVGSKLEKFLLQELLSKGYNVQFHKEQSLVNTKLQIDIFLPNMNTAIEVDGPSHFSPVWGEDALARSKTYDTKKQGLIVGKGLVLIRVKQTKDFSKTRAHIVFDKLLTILNEIAAKFPDPKNRLFEIEDV